MGSSGQKALSGRRFLEAGSDESLHARCGASQDWVGLHPSFGPQGRVPTREIARSAMPGSHGALESFLLGHFWSVPERSRPALHGEALVE